MTCMAPTRLMRLVIAFALFLGAGGVCTSMPAAAMAQAPQKAQENAQPVSQEPPVGEAVSLGWQLDQIIIETPPDFIGRMLEVEIAVSPRQRQVGLMFRKSMPEDHGMLFIFDREEDQAFWMKNTYIPLDIVFIDSKGNVVHVHEGARPLDETVIDSQKPAMAVLEVNAGSAARLGLVPGAHISYSAFEPAEGQ